MSLSDYSGRVDEHSHTESLVAPSYPTSSPVQLAPFLIPGHKLALDGITASQFPRTHTSSLMRMLSQMKDGRPKNFTTGLFTAQHHSSTDSMH